MKKTMNWRILRGSRKHYSYKQSIHLRNVKSTEMIYISGRRRRGMEYVMM
jgi:hypothetical protein